jgi:hypothetical protein
MVSEVYFAKKGRLALRVIAALTLIAFQFATTFGPVLTIGLTSGLIAIQAIHGILGKVIQQYTVS